MSHTAFLNRTGKDHMLRDAVFLRSTKGPGLNANLDLSQEQIRLDPELS